MECITQIWILNSKFKDELFELQINPTDQIKSTPLPKIVNTFTNTQYIIPHNPFYPVYIIKMQFISEKILSFKFQFTTKWYFKSNERKKSVFSFQLV